MFAEDGLADTNLLPLKNFEPFDSEVAVDTAEDAYEGMKYITHRYLSEYANLVLGGTSTVLPNSYAHVLDSFRPDFEEKIPHTDSSSTPDDEARSDDMGSIDSRLSNPFKLRAPSKGAIVTYNAMQKVFRARFDEGRSHARLHDFSNSATKHPFLTTSRVRYEQLLGKNKDAFFETALYNRRISTDFSAVHQV